MKLALETNLTVARPPAEVFDAWVDPEQMSGYFISSGSGPLEPGATVTWRWADHGDAHLDIQVDRVVAPRELSFRWSATGTETRVAVTFEARHDGAATEIVVSEGAWSGDAAGIASYGRQMQGWAHMLACLKAYLEYEGINLRSLALGPYDLCVERTMRATPAALFRAWTSEWGRWFADPPESVRMQHDSGLAYTFDGRKAIGGRRYPHYGRFVRVVPERLVELTWVTESTHGVETLLCVELEPRAGGTHLTLRHGGFADQATRDAHARNWPFALEHLDGILCAPA